MQVLGDHLSRRRPTSVHPVSELEVGLVCNVLHSQACTWHLLDYPTTQCQHRVLSPGDGNTWLMWFFIYCGAVLRTASSSVRLSTCEEFLETGSTRQNTSVTMWEAPLVQSILGQSRDVGLWQTSARARCRSGQDYCSDCGARGGWVGCTRAHARSWHGKVSNETGSWSTLFPHIVFTKCVKGHTHFVDEKADEKLRDAPWHVDMAMAPLAVGGRKVWRVRQQQRVKGNET